MTLENFLNDQGMFKEQRQMIQNCEPDLIFMRMCAEILGVGREYLDWIIIYRDPKKCIPLIKLMEEAYQQPVGVLFNCMLARQKFEVLDRLSAHHYNCPVCDKVYDKVNDELRKRLPVSHL